MRACKSAGISANQFNAKQKNDSCVEARGKCGIHYTELY